MADRATEYAREVLAGRVVCGNLHKLACSRHLNDLKRQRTEDFPYYYDEEAAARVIAFAETLTLAEGSEPKPLRLIPSQAFDLSMLFGWKKVQGGYRRFRRSYISMARQNGKSTINGLLGTYIAGFSGYKYGKIFTIATRKRQARITYEEMKKFIEADADLSELFDIKDYKSTIIAKETLCEIIALSRESGLEDGHRGIFCSYDEVHQARDGALYKALLNGQRSLPEALFSMISTRGFDLNGFGYEIDSYCCDILRGTSIADDFYVDIMALDDGDDIFDEKNWIKANPFLCLDPERMKTLRREAQTAKDMGSFELRDFICKALNMWVRNTETQFIDPEAWAACASDRTLEDIVKAGHSECYVGLDLSSGGDLTSLSLEFPLPDGRFYVYSHSFMPYGRQAEHIATDIAPYDMWAQQGLLTVTGGEMDFMTDYAFIISHLAELKKRYGLTYLGIGADPHNLAGIIQELEGFGCPVVSITQSARSLNDATVAVRLLIKGQQIEYDRKNELLSWSMVNAAVVKNSFDEIKLDKRDGAKFRRIDCADAFVDAHALMLLSTGGVQIDVDNELENYLTMMGWA